MKDHLHMWKVINLEHSLLKINRQKEKVILVGLH